MSRLGRASLSETTKPQGSIPLGRLSGANRQRSYSPPFIGVLGKMK